MWEFTMKTVKGNQDLLSSDIFVIWKHFQFCFRMNFYHLILIVYSSIQKGKIQVGINSDGGRAGLRRRHANSHSSKDFNLPRETLVWHFHHGLRSVCVYLTHAPHLYHCSLFCASPNHCPCLGKTYTHNQYCTPRKKWCTVAWIMGEVLLYCGSIPLCGSALVVDKVVSSQIVLPLLPARGQRRQQLALSGTWHVLSLEQLPTRLRNINREFQNGRHETDGDNI